MSRTIIEQNIFPNGEINSTQEGSRNYSITKFFGGTDRGNCIQLEFDWQEDKIQLTKEQTKELINHLQTVQNYL